MNYKFLSSKYRNSVIDQATSGDVPVEYLAVIPVYPENKE